MTPLCYAKFKEAIHVAGTTRNFIDVRRPECKLIDIFYSKENRALVVKDKKLGKTSYVPLENIVMFEVASHAQAEAQTKPEISILAPSQFPVEEKEVANMDTVMVGEHEVPVMKKKGGRPPKVHSA